MTLSTLQTRPDKGFDPHAKSSARWWRWIAFSLLLIVLTIAVAATIAVRRVQPVLRARVVALLEARFDSRVELDQMDVSWVRGLAVSGGGLRIYSPGQTSAGGKPLVSVRSFVFHSRWQDLFAEHLHIGDARVTGLLIDVPPSAPGTGHTPREHRLSQLKFGVDRVFCDDSRLVLESADPTKQPKVFLLKHLELDNAGNDQGWRFSVAVTNPVPRGEVTSSGSFGPWNTDVPGDTPIAGSYVFDDADLGTIKGIGGTLSSSGSYAGELDRIEVNGTASVPDFQLDTAKQPMRLQTQFHAFVNGTTGDTTLAPVEARLRNSSFTCSGSITDLKGQGHVVDLTVDVPAGRIEDFLLLAVRTRPPVMAAGLRLRAQLHIRPGREPVVDKMAMRGQFALSGIRFAQAGLQDDLDQLSLRAQARPQEAKPGAPFVSSAMTGQFTLQSARLKLEPLTFTLPGATVKLSGVYSLDGRQYDFKGNVRTEAKISEMVATWWKQLLLMPADHYFSKGGAGTEVPFSVHGTEGRPKFGVGLP